MQFPITCCGLKDDQFPRPGLQNADRPLCHLLSKQQMPVDCVDSGFRLGNSEHRFGIALNISNSQAGDSHMNVTIIGSGYVGLTTGIALAYVGHHVTCVDTDETKIASLRAGKMPFYEPHLAELCTLLDGRLEYSSDPADAIPGSDVVFIAVGTPSLPDGSPNLTYLQAVAA
jgi:hypothetical protein